MKQFSFEKKSKNDNVAVVEDNSDCSYGSIDVLAISVQKAKSNQILYLGWVFHMTPNQGWFESYKSIDGMQVLLGNNKACKVNGIGSIRIKMLDGVEKVLKKGRHVPELKRNLILLGNLSQKAIHTIVNVEL